MGLKVTGRRIGGLTARRAFEEALGSLPTPVGEDWIVTAGSAGDAWEVVLSGPCRPAAPCPDWEVQANSHLVQYRRLFRGPNERQAEFVARAVRAIVWGRIRFRPNPIASLDPDLASSFEDAVWEALRGEPLGPVQVRFNVWRDSGDVQFVCKVECSPDGMAVLEPAWRWWSPLVRAPRGLAAGLEEALEARRARSGLSCPVPEPVREVGAPLAAGS